MAHLALYRKYRPQTFDDIMGQQHVTRTLQNALRRSQVAHAYLFCGPRGTAKTTTARVLAKAMNCLNGPAENPCNECDACVRIREGHSLDVVEIDAASNRSIDDVKLLREQVGRASAQERVKFFIIDEVHQLSADAFQALLKTLEEPPPNVVFVLATTETHRVPKTIISRCQRFDFRRGTLKDLSDRLQYVADREQMDTDPEALAAIARAAAGGWRDALSLLEQVAAYSPDRIDLAAVNAVLGSVEESALFRLGDALGTGDTAALFREVETLIDDGKEPRQLLGSLGAHLRDLLWVQSGAGDAMPLSPELKVKYQEQAGQLPSALLMNGLDQISRAEGQIRWISDHRLLLELTLLKIANGKSAEDAVAPKPTVTARPGGVRPVAAVTVTGPPAATPVVERVEPPDQKPPRRDPPPVVYSELPASEPARSLDSERDGNEELERIPVRPNAAPPPEATMDDYAAPEESIEGGLDDIWARVLAQVKPNVRALLRDGKPLGIHQNKIFRVGFRYKAHADVLERKDNKEQIEKALKSITKLDLRVKGELDASGPGPNGSESASPAPRPASSFPSGGFITDTELAELFGAEKIQEGE